MSATTSRSPVVSSTVTRSTVRRDSSFWVSTVDALITHLQLLYQEADVAYVRGHLRQLQQDAVAFRDRAIQAELESRVSFRDPLGSPEADFCFNECEGICGV